MNRLISILEEKLVPVAAWIELNILMELEEHL